MIPSHRFLRNRSTDRTTIKYLFFDDLLSPVRNPEETGTNRETKKRKENLTNQRSLLLI